ncbi:peptide MFS transporter [Actinomadura alba]|uniref:Peptide MFS transporter n=2 Tax=Actinomadura alba TaxID=406431 RepID=A0ABR7LS45_9ACTN|nr:peptide MFS transporter [Actinomadura alba]
MTEMWERFSYYGMRAILVLFLSASVLEGGLGLNGGTAKALVGVYMASVYLVALPGGWISDRILGTRRCVLLGGVIIMLGHISLAVPAGAGFAFAGLALIVVGTGLLKPNVTAIVGHLYKGDEDARRDAGFSLFYMGVNIGALLGPAIAGTLGQKVGWHVGFGAAAVGMAFGLAQYAFGRRPPGDDAPPHRLTPEERRRFTRYAVRGVAVVVVVVALAAVTGAFTLDGVTWALTVITILVAAGYFAFMFYGSHGITPEERVRLKAYAWLFVAAAIFQMIYDQAATELTAFAHDKTDLSFGGWNMPSSWLQSANPIMVLLLAPVLAGLWIRLGDRVSTAVKFAIGLALAGASFLLMAAAATAASDGTRVSALWLLGTYVIQTVGELSLYPVGLSVTVKLAPAAFAGQMMGLWFLATAVGDAVGGQVTRLSGTVLSQPLYFMCLGLLAIAAAMVLAMFTRPLRRLMSERPEPVMAASG